MRCTKTRERIARLAAQGAPAEDRELAAHLESCPDCAGEWRLHITLLAELECAPPLPVFADLAPRVLIALDAPRRGSSASWQWAAAAAFAALALALGFFFGSLSAAQTTAPESMAATYQQAITALPSNSAELAYLENGARSAVGSVR